MRTILVDDEILTLEYFAEKCRKKKGLEVKGAFEYSEDALKYAEGHRVDLAVLDIEMPHMNGLELGKRLRERYPAAVIIYVTGYGKHALEAMTKVKADVFLTKPYTEEDIDRALETALLLQKRQEKRISVQAFGRFQVFADGRLVVFQNAKAKELLALCVDHMGGEVSMEEAVDKLWAQKPYDERVKRLYRKAVGAVKATLEEYGAEGFFHNSYGCCYVDTAAVECDYFEFRRNGRKGNYPGNYLFDYSWSEETAASLEWGCRQADYPEK